MLNNKKKKSTMVQRPSYMFLFLFLPVFDSSLKCEINCTAGALLLILKTKINIFGLKYFSF